ncbi:hypothetical protein HN51_001327 [Arachis hypogaea]|uniref:Glycosyltransferase n=2 Tax=Arachis TaxID=3817 RepID=A0A445ESF0_ARAHY|nr:UDP-glycosyltransferase 84B2-like [Arachis duranensis]QHO49407.1 UDP-glycosyltransferase [Arachis hypogaea]RYR78267.1 hypothetical protein Ahy_A01g003009 [Arachis hypogaea]
MGMNVIVLSLALPSHIMVVLKVAKRLISKGVHHVTIVTTEEARDNILRIPNSQSSNISFEFFSDGLSLDNDRIDREEVINSLETKGSKNLSSLISTLTKTREYSCMIISGVFHWATNIGVEHGIPCALLWIGSSSVFSICYRYFKGINVFPVEDLNENVRIPGLPTSFEVRDVHSFMLPNTPEILRKVLIDLFKSFDKVKWVIGISIYEIEEEVVKSIASLTPFYTIGPLVSPFLLGKKETNDDNVNNVHMWYAEDSCIEWLDNKPSTSVIYVSFGSLVVLSKKEIHNLAMALKNINKPFLWVLNPSKKDCVEELPPEFLQDTKGMGLVVKWCNQERVLRHPSVACFVSHGGFSSIMETIVAGVPVVCLPYFSDHPTNAMLITNVFGNGVRIKCGEDCVVSAEEFERCIWEVTDGPNARKIKNNALEMKKLARKASQEGGSADNNIGQFINEIMK